MVGRISKAALDEERARETNALDMHQNSSIVYHTESITEMQLITLVMCYVLHESYKEQLNYGAIMAKDSSLRSLGMDM